MAERPATEKGGIPDRMRGEGNRGEREKEAIEEALKNVNKVPRNDEIKNLFLSSSELCDIFKNNDFQRIRSKVKKTFKRIKRLCK